MAEMVLDREEEAGIIFITCKDLPELFVAVTSEEDVGPAVDRALRGAVARMTEPREAKTTSPS